MPDISIRGVRLPKALREMNRDDIQHAIADVRVPKAIRELKTEDLQKAMADVQLPKALRDLRLEDVQHAIAEAKLPKVELPDGISAPKIDVDLKALEARLPGRRRRRSRTPFVILGLLAAIGAAVYVVTSTPIGTRIREMLRDLRGRAGMDEEERDEALAGGGPMAGVSGGEDALAGRVPEGTTASFGTGAGGQSGYGSSTGDRPAVAVGPGTGSSSDPAGQAGGSTFDQEGEALAGATAADSYAPPHDDSTEQDQVERSL